MDLTVARFSPGDKVNIDGIVWTLGSWPADDDGPFTCSYVNKEGGEVYSTFWAGQVQATEATVAEGGAGEPAHTSAQVELVEKGDGVSSTLGDIHDALTEVDAEIEASLEAKTAAEADATE